MRLLPSRWSERVRKLAMEDASPYGASPDQFVPGMATERYLAGKQRILIVGDATRREFDLLTRLGKEAVVLDVVPLAGIPEFVQQSITEPTPFPDQSFDGVVLNDVVEHLFEDTVALREVRRVLRDDGVLVLSVPYAESGQDETPYHARVHTRRTIERLLAFCGFRIEDHFCRGLICRLPQRGLTFRCFVLLPRLALRLLLGQRGADAYRRFGFRVERWLGTSRLLGRLQRRFASYGGILKAVKAQPVDFTAIQVEAFSDKAR